MTTISMDSRGIAPRPLRSSPRSVLRSVPRSAPLSVSPARVRHAESAGRPALVPLRLTRRGRAVLVALVALVAVASFLLGAQAAAAPMGGADVVRHVVVEGETLSAIAAQTRAQGESIAAQVREIVALNGMSGAQIVAGQELVVPRG